MERIENKLEFRAGYETLRLLQEWLKVTQDDERIESLRQRIIDKKRALRAYANRDNKIDVGMGFKCEHRIIKDGGIDGYIELVSIPEVYDTLEDTEDGPGAETFFRDFFYREVRPSMYDCTGQSFTNWYKLFKRNGKFWAYHSVGFDV